MAVTIKQLRAEFDTVGTKLVRGLREAGEHFASFGERISRDTQAAGAALAPVVARLRDLSAAYARPALAAGLQPLHDAVTAPGSLPPGRGSRPLSGQLASMLTSALAAFDPAALYAGVSARVGDALAGTAVRMDAAADTLGEAGERLLDAAEAQMEAAQDGRGGIGTGWDPRMLSVLSQKWGGMPRPDWSRSMVPMRDRGYWARRASQTSSIT